MRRIHIIGRKNSGKTTLVADLVTEFNSRGLRVGTVKHTHHNHELDTPGKDSHVHREAGSAVVGILTHSMAAVFCPADPDETISSRYDIFESTFEARNVDIVLVEGDTKTSAPKLEVWQEANQSAPIAPTVENVLAVVTDDAIDLSLPVLSRVNLAAVADFILSALP